MPGIPRHELPHEGVHAPLYCTQWGAVMAYEGDHFDCAVRLVMTITTASTVEQQPATRAGLRLNIRTAR